MKHLFAIILLSTLLVLAGSGTGWAQMGFPDGNGEIGAGTGVWPASLTGAVNLFGQGVTLDLSSTLGMGTSTPFFAQARYSWKKKNTLWLSYFDTTFNGSRPLSVNFTYNNTNFFASDALNTRLHLSSMDLAYERVLFGGEQCSLDGVLTLRDISGDVSFSAANRGIGVSESRSVFFPMIGLAFRTQFSRNFRGYATFNWIDYGSGSSNASTNDWSAGLKYNFSPDFGLSGGYRNVFMHYSNENNGGTRVDATFSGPQFMLHYNF